MQERVLPLKVTERAVLKKFRETDSGLELYEVIELVDGKIVDTWKPGDDRPPPED